MLIMILTEKQWNLEALFFASRQILLRSVNNTQGGVKKNNNIKDKLFHLSIIAIFFFFQTKNIEDVHYRQIFPILC